jgi:serine/threonine protein kinase
MTITGKEGEAGSTYPRSDVAETIEPVEPKGVVSSRSLSQTDGPPPEPAHELPGAFTSDQFDLATRPGTVEETTYRYQPVDDVTEAGPIRARSDPGSHVTGDYDLLGILGKGGMGVVYEARHRRLNRVVALKMMRDGSLPDDSELIWFRNEAEAVARLDHPHIVPIYEVGEAGGKPYLSMKLVRGESLAELVPKMTADYRSSAVVVGKAAAAVQHAHERGIPHRDLKPANVLVDERGEPHVTDFGLARRIDKESDLTQSGAIMGTPG